jgi:Cdc6-like AAA superfamily ATPase
VRMPSTSEVEKYAGSLNALGVPRKKDPFPFNPPEQVDYWADNKEILQRIVQAQIDSVMFASSFIYVLYGPVGGGKTFAVKYLANTKTQKMILKSLKKPEFESFNFRVAAVAPMRTGQLTFSLHKDIVEKCFSAILENEELVDVFTKTKQLGVGNIKAAFTDVKRTLTRSLNGKISVANLENSEGYKFLIQSRSRLGKLQDVNELVEVIRILVKILAEKYGRIIISIDELENLSRASGTERVLCSDFLRKTHEMIEHDMTLFLIFTLESFEDVARLLQPALISRVKESIEFPFIKDKSDVKEYITECISQRCGLDPYTIIDEKVIDDISDSLITSFQGRISFRQINREMHRIFIDTYICADKQTYKIDYALYKKVAKGMTAEEVVKRITEKLGQKGEAK